MEERQETVQPEGGRKPYSKPTAEKILLRAEEAVLGVCKTSGGAGPAALPCTAGSCQSIAS